MMYSQRISKEKKALREVMLKKTAALKPENGKIAESVLHLPVWQNAKSVFCYVSYGYEPNTEKLIKAALMAGKRLSVPLCKRGGEMRAVQIHSINELKKGFYGILEPPESGITVLPSALDLIIVPCLAADKQKNRLGKGGGYYDRFLAHCAPECTKILLCRNELLLPEIPVEAHDIKAEILVTD